MLERRRYRAGETILRENDLGESAFIIQKGRVEITRQVGGRPLHLATLGPGETLGEMSMIDDQPRSATALALEDTELAEIHHDDFYEALQTDPDTALLILKTLFERLREANARILQLSRNAAGAASATPAVAAREAPSVLLEPESDEARQALGQPMVRFEKFPFRVGRSSHNPLVHNDLTLADEMPWQISRHHLAFVLEGGSVGLVDRGSRLGSSLDGRRLGGPDGEAGPVLLEGNEARLVLGNAQSPYAFRIRVTPVRVA
jgi:CRP-like cAMP-binding protein